MLHIVIKGAFQKACRKEWDLAVKEGSGLIRGRSRHMFAGGNTSRGFFSYYNNILRQEDANRIFILKGGPGVGKSTFMKTIADEMLERGYDVEYMHCSGDPNSLDAIVIPAIGVAMIDGTAPHVVDPKNPGAVDEIVNLGDYLNEDGMRLNKDKIIGYAGEKSKAYARAYRYLKAAECVYEVMAEIYKSASDNAWINVQAEEVKKELFGNTKISSKEGRQRHLFASAITPLGIRNYLPSLLTAKKTYLLSGSPGTGMDKFLENIRRASVERGFYTESYYCALQPERLEHLIIPEIDAAFATVNEYHNADVEYYKKIDFSSKLNKKVIDAHAEELEFGKGKFDELLGRAIDAISKARELHSHLEAYYIPNMDFRGVQKSLESILARIFEYCV